MEAIGEEEWLVSYLGIYKHTVTYLSYCLSPIKLIPKGSEGVHRLIFKKHKNIKTYLSRSKITEKY
jgi:hypothetical protein